MSNLQLNHFDFDLPDELIAQEPAEPRDSSRLFVHGLGPDKIVSFGDVLENLPENSVLVFNETKVDRSRVIFDLNGKECEIFFLSSSEALVRPGKYFKVGDNIELYGSTVEITGIGEDGVRLINFSGDLAEFLEQHGQVPLPPYIPKTNPNAYAEKYQTVYAKTPGSAAAPTAGLHFTPELLAELAKRGHTIEKVNLSVGLGTFRPLQDIDARKLHEEYFEVTEDVAERLNGYRTEGRPIIAVGTTSLRVLQSVFDESFHSESGWTDIFIKPGFDNWAIDGLITNFHLPKSSLFVLIAAFVGIEEAHKIYARAIDEKMRFYSFGDACMLYRK